MAKLTKRDVMAVPVPEKGKDNFAWCEEVRGFGVRVKPSGNRTFVIVYKTKRLQFRRMKIGNYPTLTVEEARELAKKALARAAGGEDLAQEKRKARDFVTVAEMCDIYLRDCKLGLALHKGRPHKASTIRRDEGRINRHLKRHLGSMALEDVKKADVARMHDDIFIGKRKGIVTTAKGRRVNITGGPGVARKSVFLLSAVFSYAIKKGLVETNPCSRVEVTPDGQRDRWLTPAEYARLGAALKKCTSLGVSQKFGDYFWSVALTGYRRNEILTLVPEAVDVSGGGLRVLAKNQPEGVRVLRACGEIPLQFLKSLSEGCASWVFPSPRTDAPLWGLDEQLKVITQEANLPGVTLHTLRHSFATVAGELEYSELTIGGLLGHGRSSVTGKYVHKVERALVEAANHVSSVVAERMGFSSE